MELGRVGSSWADLEFGSGLDEGANPVQTVSTRQMKSKKAKYESLSVLLKLPRKKCCGQSMKQFQRLKNCWRFMARGFPLGLLYTGLSLGHTGTPLGNRFWTYRTKTKKPTRHAHHHGRRKAKRGHSDQ